LIAANALNAVTTLALSIVTARRPHGSHRYTSTRAFGSLGTHETSHTVFRASTSGLACGVVKQVTQSNTGLTTNIRCTNAWFCLARCRVCRWINRARSRECWDVREPNGSGNRYLQASPRETECSVVVGKAFCGDVLRELCFRSDNGAGNTG